MRRRPGRRDEQAGRPSTDHWHVGDVVITKVEEICQPSTPPEVLYSNLKQADVREIDWLYPNYADEQGALNFSIQSFVIKSRGKRILVDTGVGNDKRRSVPPFDRRQGPFLANLRNAGHPPESIDLVVCTHLHVDHVGWNTRWMQGRWEPTFPSAAYLFNEVEWDHWSDDMRCHTGADLDNGLDNAAVIADSIAPVLGSARFVDASHRLTDEVSLLPTPGHTPGHVSVRIQSNGEEAVITGDVVHHPVQMARPDLNTVFDADAVAARRTRQEFIASHADRAVLVLGTHFPQPTAGRIVSHGNSWRFDTSTRAPL